MKNRNGIIGVGVFVVCLWAIAVCAYAEQVRHIGLSRTLITMDNTSCSGVSGSSGE